MFQPTGLFGQIKCPDGDRCQLLNCIFQHQNSGSTSSPVSPEDIKSSVRQGDDGSFSGNNEPPKKRQKITTSSETPAKFNPSTKEVLNTKSDAAISGRSAPQSTLHSVASSTLANSSKSTRIELPLNSVQRRISPPRSKEQPSGTQSSASNSSGTASARKEIPHKVESLIPRLVPKPPATHGVRTKLLQLIHEQFRRLNSEVQALSSDEKEKLKMSPQELVTMAVNEEERTAKSNVTVYPNVMKLRITALKKMKVEAWCEERLKVLERETPGSKAPKPVEINTGLTSQEEIALLPDLISSQEGLARYGYVTSPVPQEDIEKASQGVESAHGYEVCDRCGTRFQVFPGRREDGTLTTGGSCTYHFGRLRRPPRAGAPVNDAERYTCCQDAAGSKGCEVAQSHVFKISDPKRLALVLPFEETPTQGPRNATMAVCFDCEMGYTTYGMELIRLTATEWPGGKEVLDVLVRPLGEILDLNSRFSGVWPEEYTKALPYEAHTKEGESTEERLRIAKSPGAARALLFQYLTTTTPLIGHALENDLNAARILHPTIIDTVVLYPHPRGLPLRHGLKALMKQRLNKNIQMGGAQGHDSKEDARAAGELVRLKVAEKWKMMRRDGWTVTDGVFNPPKAL